MVIQFIVNLIVVTLVTREFSQEVTEENPSGSTEEENKNTIELIVEEELVTIKSGQEVKGRNQSLTKEDKIRENGASGQQEKKALAEDQRERQVMEPVKQSKPFYVLKAAVTAMWLPAVVGDKRNMFIAASLSTLITKILMLLLSVILVYFFQEKVHSHPFVLWSKVGKSPKIPLAHQVPTFVVVQKLSANLNTHS